MRKIVPELAQRREHERGLYHDNEDYRNKRKEISKQYYVNNKEKRNLQCKVYYHKNKEQLREKHEQWLNLHKGDISISKKRYRIRLIEILTFGNFDCCSCGYDTDVRALEIDHRNGDGKADRLRFVNGVHMYRYYLYHQEEAFEKLQILCSNCNTIKMRENKEWSL